jgi:5-methylcytosine-specific restriction enzyme A
MRDRSDAEIIAGIATAATGLAVSGVELPMVGGQRMFGLAPRDHEISETFTVTLTLGWRSVEAKVVPGKFAGDLVGLMGEVGDDGRTLFRSVMSALRAGGADVTLNVNGSVFDDAEAAWSIPWRTMELRLRRGQIDVSEGDGQADVGALAQMAANSVALILVLLPVENVRIDDGVAGFPEGAVEQVTVNRYERDRRNRAAAIAIHGTICVCCDIPMGDVYGVAAAGMIQIHHLTPVSKIGPGYVVNPETDLAPLCPNCHCVAHRRDPPYGLEEIRRMLRSRHAGPELDQDIAARTAV